MEDLLAQLWGDLTGRVTGPMSFRVIVQPAVAALIALRAGLRDAKAGRPAYFWGVLHDPSHRRDLLAGGWKDIAKIFVVAILLDVVYQLREFDRFYPGEALLVAVLLACVPYLLLRGLVNRIVGRRVRAERLGAR
jgi:hypothetical protein